MGFFLIYLYLIYRIVMKMHLNSIKCLINQAYNNFPHFVYDQLGFNRYMLRAFELDVIYLILYIFKITISN